MRWLVGSVVALASGLLMTILLLLAHVGPQAQRLSPRWLAGIVVLGVFMGIIGAVERWGVTPGAGKPARVVAGTVACAVSALLFGLPWSAVCLAGLAGAALGYAGMKWLEHV